jgi:hypothetical protein
VQFTIFDNPDVPENILESYTFTFDYSGNRGPADRRHVYTKIDILDIAGDKNAWRDVIRTGESLIRQLITMCARFPILPSMCTAFVMSAMVANEKSRSAIHGHTCLLQG